eukprot:jgi/Tetstr1/425554/TSEL_015977.t1
MPVGGHNRRCPKRRGDPAPPPNSVWALWQARALSQGEHTSQAARCDYLAWVATAVTGLPQMVHVPPDRQHFKNCSSAVGGGIGQLIVDFIIISRTQPEIAFRALWALMLGRYPNYGYVQQEAAEELLACLVRIEDGIRKRKALEAAAPADRALMAKIQAVANVQDYNRPDNKAKGRRKCSKCGSAGHNRATCPKREPAQENLLPSGPTTGHGAPATSAAAGAAP